MPHTATCPTARSRHAMAISTILSLALGAASGLSVVDKLQASGLIVSQKGRTFHPDTLSLERGETVTIVNDDSDLLHHAYVDSPTFSFDSGDQEPGSRTPITFNQEGVFQVLCGIHPKMKLVVRVK
ncbi:cupredoxin domain-containing protein [Methylobacterium persicinum]|uniref:Plastocyanin n=1 Tax=Methylobacterium persicinum TaxID=374426 RepID=A0ABU0HHV9_9HYPH|nr:plastocyanin [Methylobacterium persicinum]MDQ0441902.1 plastocyanin [Methylobacterium persicinum]